ncbi:putative ABC transporter ATP-binding protein [Gordonia effusa NBRC 100432]|uniref:Putative ABC transporter ATP-binding protein n=1 Tax=Gordonia effusa NBRC 100432 TaxID=1077974 RepID=H0QYD9_9ACTN|nr:ATP-binding cassette domain-containing protein [Gordonia effusa]GAB17840.1 putative ABC transporter ATP-binding protein [Gordonia effusa NBRC 100432]
MNHSLHVRNLAKRYGDLVALQDVSFSVAPGEIFGFVGSNGAGKSTTMRIILGVLAADSGTVAIDDAPIDFSTRRHIGYMPEERGLYPKMKVGHQLSYLARLHGFSPADAAASVARWTERLGIAERVNDDVGDLSLGNQQRVQLAAALVHDPDVLVLDEPFSGLDPVAVDVMSDVLREKANTGAPVLFSSHQLDLVQQLCDRVGVIVKGTMRAVGTVDDLRSGHGAVLEVVGPPTTLAWATGLRGVVDVAHVGAMTRLTLDQSVADDQEILHAALATGPVHQFRTSKPTLTEIFREVVSA